MSEPGSIASRPELARLFDAARRRIESRGNLSVGGMARIDDPSVGEREAVANLLGWKQVPRVGPLRVQLEALDRALRSSRQGASLVDVLSAAGGPLRDRPGERAAMAAEREELWRAVRSRPDVGASPALQRWVDDLARTGLVRRLEPSSVDAQRQLIEQALTVIACLPIELAAEGPGDDQYTGSPAGDAQLTSADIDVEMHRLNVLAASVTGDAHALDPGRPLSTLVMRAIALLVGRSVPSTAADRRDLWAVVGVACDELSCDVLTLGLRPEGESMLARWLRDFSDAGEPARITLRQLLRDPIDVSHSVVFVCENPVVVAEAADRLGPACSPLICVDGMPNTAAGVLIQQLVDRGAEVRYHGDTDAGGARIAELMRRRYSAQPWGEMASAERQTAVVYEEQVLDYLIAALQEAD